MFNLFTILVHKLCWQRLQETKTQATRTSLEPPNYQWKIIRKVESIAGKMKCSRQAFSMNVPAQLFF